MATPAPSNPERETSAPSNPEREKKRPSKGRKRRNDANTPTTDSLLVDTGPVRTRAMAKRAKRMQELQSSQESNPCSICLSEPEEEEISFAKSCFHRFCYGCLNEWAKVNNTCPLCKVSFQFIVRRSHDSGGTEKYEECPVPVRPRAVSPFAMLQMFGRGVHGVATEINRYFNGVLLPDVMNDTAANDIAIARAPWDYPHIRATLPSAVVPVPRMADANPFRPQDVQRLRDIVVQSTEMPFVMSESVPRPLSPIRSRDLSPVVEAQAIGVPGIIDATHRHLQIVPPLERQRRERQKQRARAEAYATRRRVYRLGLYAEQGNVTGPRRDTAPSHYRENEPSKQRIKSFLDREFVVMFPDEGAVEHRRVGVERVLSLLNRCHILSPEFRESLQLHVPVAFVGHFVHELYSFAASPAETLAEYDRVTSYTADTVAATASREGSVDRPDPATRPLTVEDLSVTFLQDVDPARLNEIPGPSHRPDLASWIMDLPGPSGSQSSAPGLPTDQMLHDALDVISDDLARSRRSEQYSTGFEVEDDGEVEILEELPPKKDRTPEMIDIASDMDTNETMPSEEPGTSGSSSSRSRGKSPVIGCHGCNARSRAAPLVNHSSEFEVTTLEVSQSSFSRGCKSGSDGSGTPLRRLSVIVPRKEVAQDAASKSVESVSNTAQAIVDKKLPEGCQNARCQEAGGDSEVEIVQEIKHIIHNRPPRQGTLSEAKKRQRNFLRILGNYRRESLKSSSDSELEGGQDEELRRRRAARKKRRRVAFRQRERCDVTRFAGDFSIAGLLRAKPLSAREDGNEGDNESDGDEGPQVGARPETSPDNGAAHGSVMDEAIGAS